MKRGSGIPRDWTAARLKVEEEGCCRNCKKPASVARLEAAHTLGRDYDVCYLCTRCDATGEGRRVGTRCGKCWGTGRIIEVDPRLIIPLCGPATSTDTCHGQHHARLLDLLPIMTGEEQLAAVEIIVRRAEQVGGGGNVGIAEAYRRLSGRREPPEVETSDGDDSVPAHIPGQISTYDIIG